jgi:hypothetical protein
MLATRVRPGVPVAHRGIVITPLHPLHAPQAAYLTLDEALPRGLRIRELAGGGTVPELLVENPLDESVLLYDGQELAGAMQDRILNVSVLVAAHATLTIPVSCVEVGRWQARSTAFDSAADAAPPSLRHRKAAALERAPLAPGFAQSEVWDEVARTARRLRVPRKTGASADTFRAHRASIAELEQAFPAHPDQCGAALAIGRDVCMDLVSQPAAFARLWPKLRSGYLLDALGRLDGPAPAPDVPEHLLAALSHGTVTRRPSVGGGTDLRVRAGAIIGSGLELDGELLQFSAFGRVDGRAHGSTTDAAAESMQRSA